QLLKAGFPVDYAELAGGHTVDTPELQGLWGYLKNQSLPCPSSCFDREGEVDDRLHFLVDRGGVVDPRIAHLGGPGSRDLEDARVRVSQGADPALALGGDPLGPLAAVRRRLSDHADLEVGEPRVDE